MVTAEKFEEPSNKRSGKRWFIGMALLLLGATAVVIWQAETRVPSLLIVAHPVAAKGQYSGENFTWVSNNEYIFFSADRRTLSRHRLSNGVSTPLMPPLDAQSEGYIHNASPNGQWLLWSKAIYPANATGSSIYGGPFRFYVYMTHLVDARTQEASGVLGGRWEPDSRHLFDIDYGNEVATKRSVYIYDLFAKGACRIVPVDPDVSSSWDPPTMVAPNRLLSFNVGESPNRSADDRKPVELIEYGLDKSLHITHKWSVTLPGRTTHWEGNISLTGLRVAWLVITDYVNPGLAALHHLLPFVNAPSQPAQTTGRNLAGLSMRRRHKEDQDLTSVAGSASTFSI